jgi:hypothetical protein
MTDRGINADLLLSAVAHDFSGTETGARARTFDFDYLKELCGCLITVQVDTADFGDVTASLGFPFGEKLVVYRDIHEARSDVPLNGADAFVSLAHYTVFEFIASPDIFQTSVSSLALNGDMVWYEFVASVLRQAIGADPAGTAGDWVKDREAYCLTLGCALNPDGLGYQYLPNGDVSEIQNLFIQYLNPTGPHYPRIRAIQAEILKRPTRDQSRYFYLTKLPVQVLETQTAGKPSGHAATLLNICLLSASHDYQAGTPPYHWTMSTNLAQRFLVGKDQASLLTTNLLVTFMDCDQGLSPAESEEVVEGTIPDILRGKHALL